LGITRLVWQNLHRFSACAVLVSVAVHIGINLTSMRARFTRLHRGSVGRRDASALLLYTAFITVVVTGFVVWLVLANSMPVLGPALLGPIPGMRHRWIDVHNLAGLLSLYFTVSHLRRNWPALIATVHRVHSQRTAPRPVSSTTKHTPTGGERLP
jgi:cytochrome b561